MVMEEGGEFCPRDMGIFVGREKLERFLVWAFFFSFRATPMDMGVPRLGVQLELQPLA